MDVVSLIIGIDIGLFIGLVVFLIDWKREKESHGTD